MTPKMPPPPPMAGGMPGQPPMPPPPPPDEEGLPMAAEGGDEKEEVGFRPADQIDSERCENCQHMRGTMCGKYGFEVGPRDNCILGYEPMGQPEDALAGEGLVDETAPTGI